MELNQKNLEKLLVEISGFTQDRANIISLSPAEFIIPPDIVDAFHWLVGIEDPEQEHYRIRGGE